MIIFSFKKCASESEARKVKKIYTISFIILFIVIGLALGLASKNVFNPIYKGLGEDNFGAEQATQKIETLLRFTKPLSFLVEALSFYITVWACLKLGMGKIASILWGIVALAPVVSFTPFIIILTRKFSPDQSRPIA